MARKSVTVERVQQRVDENLLTDLEQYPSQVRRWYIDNIFRRSLSYLVGFTKDKIAKTVKIGDDGAIFVKQAGGLFLQKKQIPLSSESILEAVFPTTYKRFEIVKPENEGIPKPYNAVPLNVAKITLSPNEELDVPIERFNVNSPYFMGIRVYLTGTTELSIMGGSSELINNKARGEWIFTSTTFYHYKYFLRFRGGSDGGSIYLSNLEINDFNDWNIPAQWLNPLDSITTTKTYSFNCPAFISPFKFGMFTTLKSDDGSTVTVDFQIRLRGSYKTVASSSIKSTNYVTLNAQFPAVFDFLRESTYGFFPVRVVVTPTTSATLKTLGFQLYPLRDNPINYIDPTKASYSASEVSTTLSSHTLVDYVRSMRLTDVKVDVSIASGGGQVIIKYNDNEVLNVTASGSYSIPEFEGVDIVTAEIKGDGTNASSVTFTCYEEDGAYIGGS